MWTLAGVVVGGGIGGVSSWLAGRDRFRQETDWDRRQLLREKLEEIGELADEVNRGFRELCMKFMQAITLDEPLHLESEIPFARLTLLVAFYAPE